ncbi:MAG TPA: hypothetical protein VGB94_06945 [Acidobacteriaceae bacterium]
MSAPRNDRRANGPSPTLVKTLTLRLRRKLPRALITIGCWTTSHETDQLNVLREGAKADLFSITFRDATRLCIEASKLVVVTDAAATNQSKQIQLKQ